MSEVVRISPDGESVLVFVARDKYGVVASGSSDVSFFTSLDDARSNGRWMQPTPEQQLQFSNAIEVVEAAITELDLVETPRNESRRVYRIPTSVREEAARGLRWAQTREIDAALFSIAKQLSASESIDIEDIRKIASLRESTPVDTFSSGYRRDEEGYPNAHRVSHALLGGQSGEAWLNKLARTHKFAVIASAFTFDPDTTYMAAGDDQNSTLVNALYANKAGDWTQYSDGAWVSTDEPTNPLLIELDEESVTALMQWLDSKSSPAPADDAPDASVPAPTGTTAAPDGDYFELQDIDPIARNLFRLAWDQIDWVEIDRAASLAASDGIYTPQERSSNATRQVRSAGGKFTGGSGAPGPQSESTQVHIAAKAHLPEALPLIADTNALIESYLAKQRGETPAAPAKEEPKDAPVTAAAPPFPPAAKDKPADPAAKAEDPKPAPAPADAAPGDSTATPLYLAIVDATDTTAVMDVVALVPADDTNTEVNAYKRDNGAWVAAPDLLMELRSATPPPCIQLTDTDQIKDVLRQVDASESVPDTSKDDTTPVNMNAPAPAPVTASGYGLYGQYGEIIPLYGPKGDPLKHSFVAAGVPGIADTPSDHASVKRLQQYWSHGEGGTTKVRWGAPGDLSRCHKHISKYMDPSRAWGFCQLRHKEVLGDWNKD